MSVRSTLVHVHCTVRGTQLFRPCKCRFHAHLHMPLLVWLALLMLECINPDQKRNPHPQIPQLRGIKVFVGQRRLRLCAFSGFWIFGVEQVRVLRLSELGKPTGRQGYQSSRPHCNIFWVSAWGHLRCIGWLAARIAVPSCRAEALLPCQPNAAASV